MNALLSVYLLEALMILKLVKLDVHNGILYFRYIIYTYILYIYYICLLILNSNYYIYLHIIYIYILYIFTYTKY